MYFLPLIGERAKKKWYASNNEPALYPDLDTTDHWKETSFLAEMSGVGHESRWDWKTKVVLRLVS